MGVTFREKETRYFICGTKAKILPVVEIFISSLSVAWFYTN
jgi:hypothetical protein